MAIFTNASSKSLCINHNYSIWNCKMEALFMRANFFSIVDGTKIDLGAKNLALQATWKNKNSQTQCEFILTVVIDKFNV